MLSDLDLKYYSRGFVVPYYTRRSGKIYAIDKEVKGTNLSIYALKQFKSGKWKPSKKSQRLIDNFEKRAKYNLLRASGVSYREASRLRNTTFDKVKEIADSYFQQANYLSESKGVPREYILWGFARAMIPADVEDRYTSEAPAVDNIDELFDYF